MHGTLLLGAIFALIVVWMLMDRGPDPTAKFIRGIMRQAGRWSTASEQDTNPLIRVMHANYGAAYLYALQDAGVTPEQIEAAMGPGFKYRPVYDAVQKDQRDA